MGLGARHSALALLTPSPVAHLDEGVDIIHQRLGPVHDELVHAGNGMGPGREQRRGHSTPAHCRAPCRLLGSHTHLILGLQCLKNCRNLGIMMFRGLLRASLSRSSDESSQIFCRAPKAP